MTKQDALSLMKKWAEDNKENDVLLFDTKPDDGTVVRRDERQLIRRASALTKRLSDIKKIIKGSFSEPECPEGICYFIYRKSDAGATEPLYVGISETIGKKRKVSSLFTGGWARFGEELNSNGHIGNINETLHGQNPRYKHWVDRLFRSGPSLDTNLLLIRPIYVRIELWEKTSPSILAQLGHTPLKLEEMLRLHLWRLAGYSESLLNKDGNRKNCERDN